MGLTHNLKEIKMKKLLVLLILIVPLSSFAQSSLYAGEYEIRFEMKGGELIERKLSLNQDGTFLFHIYTNIDPKQPEENKYAKGVWKVEKENIIYFYADQKTDIDEGHTLNFNNTKARYHSKSKRDKSARIIEKSLKFYDSNIFWVKSMKLLKKE